MYVTVKRQWQRRYCICSLQHNESNAKRSETPKIDRRVTTLCFLFSLFLSSGLHRMEREWTESGLRKSMNWRFIEVICFLFIWDHITVQSSRQDPSATEQHVAKQYDWLISDRGPFHHSRSYLSFVEIFHQGFTTRYKIYRWVLHAFILLQKSPPGSHTCAVSKHPKSILGTSPHFGKTNESQIG